MSSMPNRDRQRECPGLQQAGGAMRTVAVAARRKLPLRPHLCDVCFPRWETVNDLDRHEVDRVRVNNQTLHRAGDGR